MYHACSINGIFCSYTRLYSEVICNGCTEHNLPVVIIQIRSGDIAA